MTIEFRKPSHKALIAVSILAVIGVGCLIAGIVLIVKSQGKVSPTSAPLDTCDFSKEAVRSGLEVFLQKVQDTVYRLQPYLIASKPGITASEIQEKFISYDPSPSKIKECTDKSQELLKELKSIAINDRLLKPRERKALAQLRHYLQHNFGTPYDANYYAGDFLLGPNFFGWQPIFNVESHIKNALGFLKLETVTDVELVMQKLKTVNHTFATYLENLKYGVKSGMVRSVEECEAGLETFQRSYWNVEKYGAEGILKQDGYQGLLQSLTRISPDLDNKWKATHKQSVKESITATLVDYAGESLRQLLHYLATEYKEHCVPSGISSGLATLPLSYVYTNGTPDLGSKTTKTLPTGEVLNGTWAYESIMSYFTTTNDSVREVHDLGNRMVKKLYPQILKIAKEQTGQSDINRAKEKFKKILNSSDMYYVGNRTIPANESDKNAHETCRSDSEAKANCPVRWAIMQDWFKEVNQVMSLLVPKFVDMFYFTGEYQTTPNCPVRVAAKYNPASGVPSYQRSNKKCSKAAVYLIPFFLERPGPRFNQWSVNSHEARPGHHTQVQGSVEHFQDQCGGLMGWLDSTTSYTSFIEGWGLYAESITADDTDTYDGHPLEKYGMLRSQIWRALRLIVDTGLHSTAVNSTLSRDQAFQYFVDYVWDDGDVIEKEITRYQSDPGQATAYMVGQLNLMRLREHARQQLGEAFNLKDFHYHLLKEGSAPLSYITDAINEYIRCTLNKEGEGCEYVLPPKGGKGGGANDYSDMGFRVMENYY